MSFVYIIHGPIDGKPFSKVLEARKCYQLENKSNCIECSRRTDKDALEWFHEETGMPRCEIKDRMTLAKKMGNYSQEKTWATAQTLVEWRKQSETFPVHWSMKRLFSEINGGETSGGCYRKNPVKEFIERNNLRLENETEQETERKAFKREPKLKYKYQSYKSAMYAQGYLGLLYSKQLMLRNVKGWPHIKNPGPRVLTHAELKLVIRHIADEKLQLEGCSSISVSRIVCINCRLLLFLLAIQGRYRFALLACQRKAYEKKETGGGNQQPQLYLKQYIWVDGINRKMISYTREHVNRALVCETMHLDETSSEQVINHLSSKQINKLS